MTPDEIFTSALNISIILNLKIYIKISSEYFFHSPITINNLSYNVVLIGTSRSLFLNSIYSTYDTNNLLDYLPTITNNFFTDSYGIFICNHALWMDDRSIAP